MVKVSQQLGQWAEQRAIDYLAQFQYQLFCQNFHSRFGEIDSIFVHEQELIFVEVKARQPSHYAQAKEVISKSKQRKLMLTALVFLEQYPQFASHFARFDVICIDFLQQIAKIPQQPFAQIPYHLEWIENAFTFDTELITL
jgi:putative endonuclease